MNKRHMIKGLDKYLKFIKLIMTKNVKVNMYSNVDKSYILYNHSTFIGGMLKPSIKVEFDDVGKFNDIFDYNIELNHYESNNNYVEFDSSEIFTRKIVRFNFYCSKILLDDITMNIIKPFGRQFKQSIEEWEKTHKDESGYMLQPPEKSDPNYKELMKRYWYECNRKNQIE